MPHESEHARLARHDEEEETAWVQAHRQEMTEQEKTQLIRSVRSSEHLSGLNLPYELLRIMLEEILHENPLSLDNT